VCLLINIFFGWLVIPWIIQLCTAIQA
jgi:hypothetical protein